MTHAKAMAVGVMVMTGIITRGVLQKGGGINIEAWWLGHLDAIAELLSPSDTTRLTYTLCRQLQDLQRVP
jgi:hypothetical protein